MLRDQPPGINAHGAGSDDPLPALLPQHLADLRASGLSDAQIAASGFYSLQLPEAVRACLNWRAHGSVPCPCLAIPFRDKDGREVCFTDREGRARPYVRLKPDNPRTNEDGKAIKYESPTGVGN